MGLLDLPAPVLAWLDGAFGLAAPPTLRLVIWGVIGAVVSMGLYWALSPQARIARVKAEALRARRALDAYDGPFAGAWPLMRDMLRLAFRQLGLVTWPAVVASLPVLCLLVWISSSYGYGFPEAAPAPAEVAVRTFPEQLEARLVGDSGDPARARLEVVLADPSGRIVERVPLAAPITSLHKRQWWNALIGNPAGYLPDDAPVDWIELDLPERQYLPLGPAWARSWYVVFFAALLAASLAIKLAARIE